MSLTNLSPRQQFAAGRVPLRLANLFVGLLLFALAMAMMVRADLGVDPWNVFHLGITHHVPLSLGTVVVLVGIVMLLTWIPMKQWPGVGTVANVFVIGVALDVFLLILPEVSGLGWQILTLLGAVAVNGLGGAMYIGSHFGAGPRDGLMTGLHLRTGLSIRLVRTSIELLVLGIGWLLGGPVGLGTVAYALLIGPSTQFFFRFTIIKLGDDRRGRRERIS